MLMLGRKGIRSAEQRANSIEILLGIREVRLFKYVSRLAVR